jgi:hypothetical protein
VLCFSLRCIIKRVVCRFVLLNPSLGYMVRAGPEMALFAFKLDYPQSDYLLLKSVFLHSSKSDFLKFFRMEVRTDITSLLDSCRLNLVLSS